MTNIIFAVHAAIVSLCLIAEVLLKIWTLTYVPIEMHSFEENGLLPFSYACWFCVSKDLHMREIQLKPWALGRLLHFFSHALRSTLYHLQ